MSDKPQRHALPPLPILQDASSERIHHALRGRGASTNPANRFDRIELVPDPAAEPDEEPALRTVFLRDSTLSVLARNDSPDVGFSASVNPYRGCEHGCSYCSWGETPILMADGLTRPLSDLQVGDEVYGTVRRGWYRRYLKTRVLAHWEVDKPAYRILLQDGTELIASGDHRFLTWRGWKYVTGRGSGSSQRPHLTINDKLMGVGRFARSSVQTSSYKRGYLCGVVRGDGHLKSYEFRSASGHLSRTSQFRLAMADQQALVRAARYLSEFGVQSRGRVFQAATATLREVRSIGVYNRHGFERIEDLVRWPSRFEPEWARGFLAGIFDAEGSCSDGAFRIPNTDGNIIEEILRSLQWWSFRTVVERVARPDMRPITVVRLRGGVREHLRFFHTTDPAILRKRDMEGQALKTSAPLGVIGIEPLGRMLLFDITTGTGDFIANGVVSHNCYARPTHEYLGFSAGLDFETRILVKEDAPELLRRELSSTKWLPQVVALSGVTDPYQPVERRLRLTRRCLEVLADFRNPVIVITKNHRVTRDIDVLRDLAEVEAVAVFLSVTTLDPDVARVMEPRASTPARRLAAIRALAAAGIPTGVMVAPVIPALTDHELAGIVAAAAEAGARYAGFTLLRLPHGVKEIFESWLGEHFPDRKGKVLNRIREIRGGKLNDPRFGSRMRGEGVFAEQIASMFTLACRRSGIVGRGPNLSTASFRVPRVAATGPSREPPGGGASPPGGGSPDGGVASPPGGGSPPCGGSPPRGGVPSSPPEEGAQLGLFGPPSPDAQLMVARAPSER